VIVEEKEGRFLPSLLHAGSLFFTSRRKRRVVPTTNRVYIFPVVFIVGEQQGKKETLPFFGRDMISLSIFSK